MTLGLLAAAGGDDTTDPDTSPAGSETDSDETRGDATGDGFRTD